MKRIEDYSVVFYDLGSVEAIRAVASFRKWEGKRLKRRAYQHICGLVEAGTGGGGEDPVGDTHAGIDTTLAKPAGVKEMLHIISTAEKGRGVSKFMTEPGKHPGGGGGVAAVAAAVAARGPGMGACD